MLRSALLIVVAVVFLLAITPSSAFPVRGTQRCAFRTDSSTVSRLPHGGGVVLRAHDDDDEEEVIDGAFGATSFTSRRLFLGSCLVATAAAAASPAIAEEAVVTASPPRASSASSVMESFSNMIAQLSDARLESISGFVSGTAVSAVKTLVKYPLDTATVRLQMPSTSYSLLDLPALFEGSFRGISAPLISNVPAGAVFFAVKDAAKAALKESYPGLPRWAGTTAAVASALPLYWAIRNPSEVVKTRLQVGSTGGHDYGEETSTSEAFRIALSNNSDTSTDDDGKWSVTQEGVKDLYSGYPANVAYGLPADVIKFVVYERLGGGRKNLSAGEGALYGAASTAVAQLVTTPLDVVRNRIMAETAGEEAESLSYFDRFVRIANEEGVEELFAGSTPRVAKAVLSGALQFATYEETKRRMAGMFPSSASKGA